jgi:hypothetical protein
MYMINVYEYEENSIKNNINFYWFIIGFVAYVGFIIILNNI